MKRLALTLRLAAMMVAPASAAPYLSEVRETATYASIHFFDKGTPNASTTDHTAKRPVPEWTLLNSGDTQVIVRVYTQAATGFFASGAPNPAENYVEICLKAGMVRQIEGVEMIGWRLMDNVSNGELVVTGWQR